MSSSSYLYLLFLLSIVLLAFLSKAVRVRATRAIYAIAHVPAPTTHELEERPPNPTMSDVENERWKALINESEATVEIYLVSTINIDLATLIRSITFRVFLVVFLGVDRDKFAFSNVQLVTGALSEFYQGQLSALPPEVESILSEWLPHKRFPSSLDKILPAYEVLWRVVATLVVTCEEDKSLRWVMMDFRDNPRDRQYRTCLDAGRKSVSAITDDVVHRLKSITHFPSVAISNWPLNCIRYASGSSSTMTQPPTEHEALKLAALLASMVVGLVGVHYGISSDGAAMGAQAAPWGQRKIFGMQGANSASQPGHVTVNVLPLASTSKQTY